MKLIEAVPNSSEARNPETLAHILGDLQAAAGNIHLLQVDSNVDANRTVLTLAGHPQHVVQACFLLFKTCAHTINMQFHQGAHPRLGAVDVCPLVPLSGITLAETAAFANQLAWRVADELHIPVYLYEANATAQERKNLSFLRFKNNSGLSL